MQQIEKVPRKNEKLIESCKTRRIANEAKAYTFYQHDERQKRKARTRRQIGTPGKQAVTIVGATMLRGIELFIYGRGRRRSRHSHGHGRDLPRYEADYFTLENSVWQVYYGGQSGARGELGRPL